MDYIPYEYNYKIENNKDLFILTKTFLSYPWMYESICLRECIRKMNTKK
jgi:hypothetical protein